MLTSSPLSPDRDIRTDPLPDSICTVYLLSLPIKTALLTQFQYQCCTSHDEKFVFNLFHSKEYIDFTLSDHHDGVKLDKAATRIWFCAVGHSAESSKIN